MAGYYGRYDVSHKASEPRRRITADRAAADEIKEAAAELAPIPQDRYEEKIGPKLFDRGIIGRGEEPLIDLMDSASDRRLKVTLDGQRVRLSDGAKKAYLADKAAFEASQATEPEGLTDAAYRSAISGNLRDWLMSYAERVRQDDPEGYDAQGFAEDLRVFQVVPFRVVDDFNDTSAFTISPVRPETAAFYATRQFQDESGDAVPSDSVDLRALHFSGDVSGGQDVTAIFAMDRRTGARLSELEIHE